MPLWDKGIVVSLCLVIFAIVLAFQSAQAAAEGSQTRTKTRITPKVIQNKQIQKTPPPKLDMTAPPRHPISITPKAKKPTLLEKIRQGTKFLLGRFRGTISRQVCGNGELEGTEECDDGNTVNGDGCSCACALEPASTECGNGICEVGEGGEPGCAADCCVSFDPHQCVEPPTHTVRCGDCVQEELEECDDGNTRDGDGCSQICRREESLCGNSIVEPRGGEDCDDGNTVSGDGCDSSCHYDGPTVCGNGIQELRGGEECDDGNTTGGDGCSATCSLEYSGFSGTPVMASDREACRTRDASELRPGYRERDDPGCERHISVCETPHAVRDIICGCAEEVTVSIASCPCSSPCQDGACDRRPSCQDTDPENDTHVSGTVSGNSAFGTCHSYQDWCSPENPTYVYQVNCNLGPEAPVSSSGLEIPCPYGEHCESGVCVRGEVEPGSCVDSDSTDDPHILGTVSWLTTEGESLTRSDYCFPTDPYFIYEIKCRPPDREDQRCPGGEYCEGGVCVVGTAPCACRPLPPGFWIAGPEVLLGGGVVREDCGIDYNFCTGSTQVRFVCGPEGTPPIQEWTECPRGCSRGVCL